MKSILVTGATGFIGGNLVRHLVGRGERVHVFCRSTSDVSPLQYDGVRIVHGELTQPNEVEAAMNGCDRVYHLAGYAQNWARDPQTYYTVNVMGTETILSAARRIGVKKVVVTSTDLTFGPSSGVAVDEMTVRRVPFFTDYERSKQEAETLVLRHAKNGLGVVVVNPTRVFGPGLLSEGNSVTKMIDWYIKGKWHLILGNGSSIGNYAFVDDVVAGHLLAMESGRSGEKYILGGENVSFDLFFATLARIAQKRYTLVHIPVWTAMIFATVESLRGRWFHHHPMITPEWVHLFQHHWLRSSAKAEQELGFKITPFPKAMEKTVSWLAESNNK